MRIPGPAEFAAPYFTCPRCGRTSHHPDDALDGYCGACRDFTRNEPVTYQCPACGSLYSPSPARRGPFACATGHEPAVMTPSYPHHGAPAGAGPYGQADYEALAGIARSGADLDPSAVEAWFRELYGIVGLPPEPGSGPGEG